MTMAVLMDNNSPLFSLYVEIACAHIWPDDSQTLGENTLCVKERLGPRNGLFKTTDNAVAQHAQHFQLRAMRNPS